MPRRRRKLVVNEPTLRRPSGEADVGHRAVGVAQQRGRPLQATSEEVLVRRLAERAPELAAEVRGRQVRGAGERRNVERLAKARVHHVLGAKQMSFWRNRRHSTHFDSGPPRASLTGNARVRYGSCSTVFSSPLSGPRSGSRPDAGASGRWRSRRSISHHYSRADGTTVALARGVPAWCGAFDEDNAQHVDAVRVMGGKRGGNKPLESSRQLGRTSSAAP